MTREDLFPYQHTAVAAAVERQRLGLLLPPGYGKTLVTETALADRDAFPALVVAPARVVETDVWGAEAAAWDHLDQLRVAPLVGTPAQRERALAENAEIDVVSYENFLWLTDRENVGRRYRSIVFDELSKMKHADTRRFRRARSAKGGAGIPTRFGLTGSPVGNHIMDLWGEMHMVAPLEAPLGPTFAEFAARYFRPVRFARTAAGLRPVAWELLPGARDEIFRRVKRYSFALPPPPEVRVPPVRRVNVRIPMTPRHRRISEELKAECVALLDSGVTLEALSGTAVAAKLRQLAGGAVWVSKTEWEAIHDAKVDAVLELVEELQGQPLLVFTWYQPEQIRLGQALEKAGANWRVLTDREDVEAWNRGEVEVLLAHPQSAGHGLNLQRGGSHVAWYTVPFSYELIQQGEGRLARTGQRAGVVISHWLLCGPGDEWIAERVLEKGAEQDALMAEVAK